MSEVSREQFYRLFSKALDERSAGLFVGAGLSAAVGYPAWKAFLREVAEELELEIDRESDLLSLAQFHVTRNQSRNRLNELIRNEFEPEKPLHDNHRLIASLPIETVWTTNYDRLLERAYAEARKKADVKRSSPDLSSNLRGRDVTVYKMHGDVGQAHEVVITKEDYELYSSDAKRGLFTLALQGDLVNKTLLFLGFSLEDPNIDYILGRIRSLLGDNQRNHFCIMKWPQPPGTSEPEFSEKKAQYDYDLRRLQLRVSDLKRYGIQVVRIDGYAEITDILRHLNLIAHRNSIAVCGSAHDFLPFGESRLRGFAYTLGKKLIEAQFNLVSGLGKGIGGDVLLGALESVYHDNEAVPGDRIVMRPFPLLPLGNPQRAEI